MSGQLINGRVMILKLPFVSVVCFFDFDKSQRKKDTECSFIPENSISWESGQADISSKIPNKTGVSGENCGPCM